MNSTGQLGSKDSNLPNIALGQYELGSFESSEILTFTEDLDVELVSSGVKVLSESLTFTEDSSIRNATIRVSKTEKLVFVETRSRLMSFARGKTELLDLEENVKLNRAYTRNLSETLTFNENLVKTRFNLNVDETLTLNESLSVKKIIRKSIVETLTLNETLVRTATLNRSLSETLVFKSGYTKKFGNGSLEVFYPEVQFLKKANYFLLKGFTSSITLPNPEFDDSEANGDILTVYRSMANTVYTYVKVQELKVLSYSFVLTRRKSIELRQFFDVEKANKITIQNHKSEIWVGYLTSNPVTFTTTKRAAPCGEQVEVSLEFEAVKVF